MPLHLQVSFDKSLSICSTFEIITVLSRVLDQMTHKGPFPLCYSVFLEFIIQWRSEWSERSVCSADRNSPVGQATHRPDYISFQYLSVWQAMRRLTLSEKKPLRLLLPVSSSCLWPSTCLLLNIILQLYRYFSLNFVLLMNHLFSVSSPTHMSKSFRT